jgi:hypothetical protein
MAMKFDLPLKEELKTFYNSVMKRLYGTKREEATGGWRKFRNEKVHNFMDSKTDPSVTRKPTSHFC